CNPNLNQVCANGQNTCQTITKDNAPTVSIAVNPTSVAAGQVFNVTVTGTDDVGLSAIWWWAVDSTDTELNKAHWYSCYNAKYCSNSWLASTNAAGTIKLGANSRDTSYPVAGEAHQASEGAGIAYAVITVSGATNASNVSGELPDLIISDFKSYTGTTNTYVTISATIKNIGGSVTVGNLCDSLYVETLNARGFCGAKLNPGETRVIQSDYALPMPGTYKIRADTDYGILVAESNENNNVAWQTITVTSPYSADYVKANTDLTVTDIDVQLPTTSTGQTNIYVTTKNLGSLATGQYWVLTKVTNVDTGKITNVQRLAPVMQPGGTYSTHHGSVGIIEYGTYKVEAWVDHYSYIAESDENNNYLSKTVVYGTTNVTATCTDSDNGNNYYTKGTTKDAYNTYTD
ncbi:MAG: CARDB domain-containing protein, partial [Nanoarchaeota archaeon]